MSYLLAQATATHIPLRAESVQCCVTSPPYWGLRSYAGEQRQVWGGKEHTHQWQLAEQPRRRTDDGQTGSGLTGGLTTQMQTQRQAIPLQAFCACGAWYGAIGLESTPEMYVEHIVAIFREVRRVLRKDGTLWLNLGDSYAGGGKGGNPAESLFRKQATNAGSLITPTPVPLGFKPKDLVGIPWRVAFALQADGWYLRSDIIWAKPNQMPESVTDRPTKAHEYLFLLSKSERDYYDADAIREPAQYGYSKMRGGFAGSIGGSHGSRTVTPGDGTGGRNARTVWTIATQPYRGAHFATFPEALVEPCVLAGSAPQACGVCGAPWGRTTGRDGVGPTFAPLAIGESGALPNGPGTHRNMGGRYQKWLDSHPAVTIGWRATCKHGDGSGRSVVLDPFVGSGTVVRVARRHGRDAVGLDLSREYLSEQALGRVDPIAAAAQEARRGGAQQVMEL